MNLKSFISLIMVLLAGINTANATLIVDRTELNTILGPNAILEDFETYRVTPSAAISRGIEYDSTSGIGGEVVEGVKFIAVSPTIDSGFIQLNGIGYSGQISQNLNVSDSSNAGPTLRVEFSVAVDTLGLDLGVFNTYTDIATITLFNDADDIINTPWVKELGSNGAIDTFFGIHEVGIIKAIEITGTLGWSSPLLDNLTFGTAYEEPPSGGGPNPIPEPTTIFMFLIGLLGLAKRRI